MSKDIVPVIIDGPNFINRLLDLQINKKDILERLRLNKLRSSLDTELQKLQGLEFYVDMIEFVCSVCSQKPFCSYFKENA